MAPQVPMRKEDAFLGLGDVVERGRLPALDNSDDRLPRHTRSVGAERGGSMANGRTAPTFEVSRPSRSRWASSASWARSASTTKKIARPFAGWIVVVRQW